MLWITSARKSTCVSAGQACMDDGPHRSKRDAKYMACEEISNLITSAQSWSSTDGWVQRNTKLVSRTYSFLLKEAELEDWLHSAIYPSQRDGRTSFFLLIFQSLNYLFTMKQRKTCFLTLSFMPPSDILHSLSMCIKRGPSFYRSPIGQPVVLHTYPAPNTVQLSLKTRTGPCYRIKVQYTKRSRHRTRME